MLKFSLQLFAFLLSIGLIIMLMPTDKERMYRGLEEDCFNHASWMYDRLYQNPIPVDIAFVGSSHTINGINDSLIAEKLGVKGVLNFGYCRHGRNLDLLLAREIIEEKQPELLVAEVRVKESAYSHPIFPYLAENQDLLSAYPFFNKDWFSDYILAFQYRLQLLQEAVWQTAQAEVLNRELYGFAASQDTMPRKELNNFRKQRHQKESVPGWKENFEFTYPRHHLKRLGELCHKHEVELVFLFIPASGMPQKEPLKMEEIKQYGPILLPPDSIWQNPNHWWDENHLNQAGARKLSEWTAVQLENSRILQL